MIHTLTPATEFEQKETEAIQQFKTLLAQNQSISLKKNVKHIFKERDKKPNLDLRNFNQVISVDTEAQCAVVEGMTSFYDLVEATLAYNMMPQAVPELRSITVGGAVAGLLAGGGAARASPLCLAWGAGHPGPSGHAGHAGPSS